VAPAVCVQSPGLQQPAVVIAACTLLWFATCLQAHPAGALQATHLTMRTSQHAHAVLFSLIQSSLVVCWGRDCSGNQG
jgi:hypothetical protein